MLGHPWQSRKRRGHITYTWCLIKVSPWCCSLVCLHSLVGWVSHLRVSQPSNARRVRNSAIILQDKIPTNVESVTLTAKLNAVSENFFYVKCVLKMK